MCFSQNENEKVSNHCLPKYSDSYYNRIQTLLFNSFTEAEFIGIADKILDELIEFLKNDFHSHSKCSQLRYEHINAITKFITRLKELYILTKMMMRSLKTENNLLNTLINRMKSESCSIKKSLNDFIESLEAVSQNHCDPAKNVLNWLENFSAEEAK